MKPVQLLIAILGSLFIGFGFGFGLSEFEARAAGCGLQVPCTIGDRSYHVRLPDGWDGKSQLPVLLYFHGWGRQGSMVINNRRIAGATRNQGVLLVAPNGLGRSWSFWGKDNTDVGFASSILEDIARRWPINSAKVFVSGYSYGSAMAWRFACSSGKLINTVLAISGTLRDPGETCSRPVNLRHVHGLKDTVMRYPFGTTGGVEDAVALWLGRNGCARKADDVSKWQAVKKLPFERHTWIQCKSGKSVVLDVHQRGHFIPRLWIEKQLRDLL